MKTNFLPPQLEHGFSVRSGIPQLYPSAARRASTHDPVAARTRSASPPRHRAVFGDDLVTLRARAPRAVSGSATLLANGATGAAIAERGAYVPNVLGIVRVA